MLMRRSVSFIVNNTDHWTGIILFDKSFVVYLDRIFMRIKMMLKLIEQHLS